MERPNFIQHCSKMIGILLFLLLCTRTQCFQPKTFALQSQGVGLKNIKSRAECLVLSEKKGFGKETGKIPKKKKTKKQSASQEIRNIEEQNIEMAKPFTSLEGQDENLPPGSRQDEILGSILGSKPKTESDAQKAGLVDRDGNPLKDRYYLVDFIPIPVQNAIEQGLIVGLGLLLLLFLAAGIGIGLSGFAISTGNPLPQPIESFIVEQLEPAFTPSLVVFFVLSSFLGVFKSFQFESRSDVTYKEK